MYLHLSLSLSLILILVAGLSLAARQPYVETEDGALLGTTASSWGGREYYQFLGIPYAEPPLKELRFLPPLPKSPWDHILEATQWPPSCSQINQDGFAGQEDCLYLNIFTPTASPLHSLPVLVFLHGGGLIFGSGKGYNPDFFMDEDVIVASINYRLGPLGFLSLNSSDASGNQGLRDQALGMAWIKENIRHFGGDPDLITIFGQSAGSWSVVHQLLNPKADGLFTHAIAQSGTILDGLSLNSLSCEVAALEGLDYAALFGCNNVTCMQAIEAKDLILKGGFFPRGSVDSCLTDDPVLPEDPELMFKNGDFHQVPLMIGATDAEAILVGEVYGLVGLSLDNYELLNDFWPIIGPVSLFEKFPTPSSVKLANTVRDYYLESGSFDKSNEQGLVDMYTDSMFHYGIHRTARLISEYQPAVYQYMFTHRGPYQAFDVADGFHGEKYGVSHCGELFYLFNWSRDSSAQFDSDDFFIKDIMVKMWTSFATYGDPVKLESLEIDWPTVKPGDFSYMNISTDIGMVTDGQGYRQRMEFWIDLMSIESG